MNKVALKIYQAGGARALGVGVFLMATLMLSACGFHLKGMGSSATATYHSIKIEQQSGVRNDVAQVVTQELKSMGVRVVSSLADAEMVLKLGGTQLNSSVTARDGQGNVSGELLKMVQPFSAQVVATEKQVIDTKAITFRDISVNAAQAQASNRELMSIQSQMANEVALQVLDRLNRSYALMQEKVAPVSSSSPSSQTSEK